MGFVGLYQHSHLFYYFYVVFIGFPCELSFDFCLFFNNHSQKKSGLNFIFCLMTWPKPEMQAVFSCFPGLSHVTSCLLTNNSQQKDFSFFVSALNIRFSPLSIRYHTDNLLTTVFCNFLSFFRASTYCTNTEALFYAILCGLLSVNSYVCLYESLSLQHFAPIYSQLKCGFQNLS